MDERARIDLMYEESRMINLELQRTYGTRMYKGNLNYAIENEKLYKDLLERTTKEVTSVNMTRKRDQELNAEKLLNLKAKNFALHSSNKDLLAACENLEQNVKKLKSR